ncbi:MAG TPA: type II toxin-antitoxin system VapC family toxin [Acetobacteraceae bacterium]|jgi:uncharacterized protein with PIN domain|nr:type II toxin-antitoxin system VapC family toxin [Acetobacteraceae bacterium]
MSAVNRLEATIRVDERGTPAIAARFPAIVGDARIEVACVTRARLDLGDGFDWAPATTEADALLFEGDHFPLTDIASALPA